MGGPLGPEGADANSHRILERVPDLIRGSGLSPRRSDLSIEVPNTKNQGPLSSDSETPTITPLVVPVPAAIVPATPRDGSSPDGSSEQNRKNRSNKDAESEEDTEDWNPNDPKWRAPGGLVSTTNLRETPVLSSGPSVPPLPIPTSLVATPTSNGRSDGTNSTGQAIRDQDARRIIEAELQRADKTVARLTREVEQGGALAKPALERAQRDQASLRAELKRLDKTSK
jgi:hypothetical protein